MKFVGKSLADVEWTTYSFRYGNEVLTHEPGGSSSVRLAVFRAARDLTTIRMLRWCRGGRHGSWGDRGDDGCRQHERSDQAPARHAPRTFRRRTVRAGLT